MKFYLFYLKHDRQLYAFTTVKAYAETFLEQRNPDCFKVKTVKLSGENEKIFMFRNKFKMLYSYPYQTGIGPGNYVELIATAEEDNNIDNKISEIENDISNIDEILRKYPIKEKYMKSLQNLTDIYDTAGNILLDVFSLFVDINRDTFIERSDIN